MAMKRCPICGEKYSDTYKTCPFCEEEEALQSGSQIRRNTGRGGKRAARSRQPNLLSPILIVLIVIMLALLVYLLFGDQIADRLSGGADGTQDQQVEGGEHIKEPLGKTAAGSVPACVAGEEQQR